MLLQVQNRVAVLLLRCVHHGVPYQTKVSIDSVLLVMLS